ncbi:MAG: SHD1 domain-containing protein [Pirellulaceae bacterium]
MIQKVSCVRRRPLIQLSACLAAMLLVAAARAEQPTESPPTESQPSESLPGDRLETGLVEIRDLAITADGKLLAVAGNTDYGTSGVVQLWDVAKKVKLLEQSAAPNLAALSLDGARLVFEGKDGGLRWLDADLKSKQPPGLDFDRLIDVCFLRDGGVVVAGFNATAVEPTADANAKPADTATNGKQVVGWNLGQGQPRFAHATGDLPIRALDVFPDAARVAIGTSEGGLCIWDVQTGQCAVTLSDQGDYDVVGVSVSPDGKRVASKLYATEVVVWDLASGEKTATLSGSGNLCPDVVFLADGETVAAASSHARGTTVSLWDAATGRPRAVLRQAPLGEPGSGRIGRLAASADGQRLAASDHEGTVLLWEIGSFIGKPVAPPLAAELRLKPIAMLPPETSPPAAGPPSGADSPPALPAAFSRLRVWTSADGKFTVEARLLETAGDLVYLRRENGQELQVRLDQLSDADRRFVREALAK